MSIIPKEYRAIPDPVPIKGEWMAWRANGKNGPGRWSSRHYTTNGLRFLCGKKVPHSYEAFDWNKGAVDNVCPGCLRKLNIPKGEPLSEII